MSGGGRAKADALFVCTVRIFSDRRSSGRRRLRSEGPPQAEAHRQPPKLLSLTLFTVHRPGEPTEQQGPRHKLCRGSGCVCGAGAWRGGHRVSCETSPTLGFFSGRSVFIGRRGRDQPQASEAHLPADPAFRAGAKERPRSSAGRLPPGPVQESEEQQGQQLPARLHIQGQTQSLLLVPPALTHGEPLPGLPGAPIQLRHLLQLHAQSGVGRSQTHLEPVGRTPRSVWSVRIKKRRQAATSSGPGGHEPACRKQCDPASEWLHPH